MQYLSKKDDPNANGALGSSAFLWQNPFQLLAALILKRVTANPSIKIVPWWVITNDSPALKKISSGLPDCVTQTNPVIQINLSPLWSPSRRNSDFFKRHFSTVENLAF
jgi:hypothetical protein